MLKWLVNCHMPNRDKINNLTLLVCTWRQLKESQALCILRMPKLSSSMS